MICQMSLSKLLKLLNCSFSHDCISVSLAPNSGNRPLAPNSGGTRKIRKFFQSPPELGDLGGLNTLKHRQKNLQSKLAMQ